MHTWPLLNAASASLAFWLFLSSPEDSYLNQKTTQRQQHTTPRKRGAKEENTRKKATTEEQSIISEV
jgi:hypothetical protein